jgi:hypothetical protein
MLEKLMDEGILSALLLMSKNRAEGIPYIEFVKQNNIIGAIELMDKGYAEKVGIRYISEVPGEKTSNYKLTPKGIKYLREILRLSYKEFDKFNQF